MGDKAVASFATLLLQLVGILFIVVTTTTTTSTCADAWQPVARRPASAAAARWSLMVPRLSSASSSSYSSSSSFAVLPPETLPLAPTTFAGMVEGRLVEKFGAVAVHRVIQSWRFLVQGYEHREFVGPKQDPPIWNAETSNCHQHAPSYVPGLTAQAFWTLSDFPWTQKIQSRYDDIRDEFQTVTADMDKLTLKGNNIWAAALTEDASSYGTGWRTLVLMDRGRWDPVNVNLFPKAAKAVYESGCPVVEVFFASLKGHSDVKMHSDFTNFLLTSHLAVDIPENGKNKCRITIGDETRQWINGEMMLFDGTIMHHAVNESDQTRYLLMLRLWHPELTLVEREALQYIYDCLDYPELMDSQTLRERLEVERAVEDTRVFPLTN